MKPRIAVVGGGISGLAAAHRLTELSRQRRMDLELVLLEAGPRLGGSIHTEQIDGFLVEAGPDSFISEKPWALRLCERLGISSRLTSTNAARQSVYVVHKGSLLPLPEGFFLLAPTRFWPLLRSPLFSWRGKLRMALELFLPRGNNDGDESLASFVRRRFGSEVLDRVAQPLIGGIYAADAEELSLAATMPRFLEMERARRSIVRAMWEDQRRRSPGQRTGSGARWSLFVTLTGGMQELVDAIAGRLPAGTVRLQTPCTKLEWNATAGHWTLSADGKEKIDASGLIIAAPAYRAGEMFSTLAPALGEELRSISYASTATVSLAYQREDVPSGLDSFGFVVPRAECRKIIACTFSSVKYAGRAPQGRVLLRTFVGGMLQTSLLEQDDKTMERSVRQELADLVGIEAQPIFCRIFRHPRSMPQYQVGHPERIRRIESQLAGLPAVALAGSAYHGVGIADCIHSGEEAAETVLCHLQQL